MKFILTHLIHRKAKVRIYTHEDYVQTLLMLEKYNYTWHGVKLFEIDNFKNGGIVLYINNFKHLDYERLNVKSDFYTRYNKHRYLINLDNLLCRDIWR